ncbi:hypothetical protein [Maliponia aquimaris]|uniref:Lipoprotein n=1 Tax=Maliponia aquimaris TaxID=1673631 RepID=A0A238KVY1_9RHOB|nr:hypothetical protein [Maliponia aquimaris]SMX46857.1 hypothetical protein MAA8898_03543 [Maliponia aquimaris]
MRWIAFAFGMLATPALSLSCLSPDPVSDFKVAEQSSDRWGIAVGRLDFDEGRLPVVDIDRQEDGPPQTDIRAQFVGKSLDSTGFNRDFQANVTLRVQCLGPWCIRPQSGRRYLAFIRHEGGKRVIPAEVCGNWLYPNPARADLDRLHRCFVGGPCEERGF